MYSRGGRGGRFGNWRARPAAESEETPPPPLGELIETIAREEFEAGAEMPDDQGLCGITDTELVASYNWVDGPGAKIVVPGKPPLWTPPKTAQQLCEDSGVFYRDRNAASYPRHPMEPAVVAVMRMQPDGRPVDVVACGSTLGNLLRYVRGEDQAFRMLVEVVGQTVHLVRREKSPTEQIPGVWGYGHSFLEAYTTWEPDVQGSLSHQRIVGYRLGGLDVLVRFEADGYVDETPGQAADASEPATEPRTDPTTDPKTDPLDQLGDLRLGRERLGGGRGAAESSPELEVGSAGAATPQAAVFDIKTRSVRLRDTDTLAEQLPRLWVSQVPNFVLAHHVRGLFGAVDVRRVAPAVGAWERDNQPAVRRLVALLRRLLREARARAPETDLELVRPAAGAALELRARLADAGAAFSPRVRLQWQEWLDDGRRVPSDSDCDVYEALSEYSAESSDCSWKDLTACDKECGYCGRCPY